MENSYINSFEDFLTNKNILITSHDLVDLDGLSSSLCLNFFLQNEKNLDTFLYFSKISKHTEFFLEKFKEKFPKFIINIEHSIRDLEIDGIIILDANELDQIVFLEDLKQDKSDLSYFFIDHHYRDNINVKNNQAGIILDNYISTAEIIVDLLNKFNFEITRPLKYLLVAGILSDSGYFKFGNNHTIKTISELLDDEVEYQEILMMLKSEPDISKKIAQIKGAQRAEFIKQNDWLIGISEVSSFESSVANTLIKIGFDIAIVFSERKEEYRVSLRAKKKVCIETNLHLGKILEGISKECNAVGGGHDGAASINIPKEKGNLRDIILAKIKDILNI
ncbi:MAG: hypothetical protein EU518_01135 [Promethearchaeota archaeon]|nr:MAG: hypothetical protein EU518_01135 [Candidatus Lokiarchaeota archaeon]